MNRTKLIYQLLSLGLATVVLVSPALAQRRNPPKKAAAEEPAPTFDSLLATESYKVYSEVRSVGTLVRSPAVNDLLEPFIKLSRPPKEFKTVVKWLDAHAEALAGSRMMVAGWPSRPNLPTVLIAIEFSSPEEAKKFYPELLDFLPKLLPTPTPAPIPVTTQVPNTKGAAVIASAADNPVSPPARLGVRTTQNIVTISEPQSGATLPPYKMKLAGSLVFISDTAFSFRNLRPRGSKPLEEDQNFQLARNRFATESLFLYVDLKTIEKEEKAQQQKWEEERKRFEAEAAKREIEEKVAALPEATEPAVEEELPPPVAEPSVVVEPIPGPDSRGSTATGTLSAGPQRGVDEVSPAFFSLYGALFGGETKWPDAVGVALVLENDAYVVRTLIINSAENKGVAIPFVPQFASGPAISPQASSIFPANTDLFVSVSLDYPQIYEGMLKSIANAGAIARRYSREPAKEEPTPESPFAVLEKKLGLKIKDDLLPLLGNEMALALPKKPKPSKDAATSSEPENTANGEAPQTIAKTAEPVPVVAIAVKDREAVKRLLPKLIEALGFKGAALLAQTEKRDSTEITTYAGIFSYAFVEDFLIVSPDAAATRQVVEAYLNHQTLSSDSHFKNFTRWQPHQVLGQVYIAPDLIETYNPFGLRMNQTVSAKMNDFLSRINPVIEPTTYALSNDGSGPLHELHIPRSLLQWLIGSSVTGFEAASQVANEAAGKSLLRTVYSAEATYQATQGKDNYGSLDELVAANLISKEMSQQYGYIVEVNAAGNKFEATARPAEYGVTGTISYFIDESGVLRGGDHGGGAATVADQPIE